MIDKLERNRKRYEEIETLLSDPDVTRDYGGPLTRRQSDEKLIRYAYAAGICIRGPTPNDAESIA